MSGSSFVVGAEFVLGDKYSAELRRLIEGLESAKRLTTEMQAKFDTLGLGSVVTKMKGEWDEIARISTAGAEKVLKTFAGLGTGGAAEFEKISIGATSAFDTILTSSVRMQGDVIAEMKALTTESVEALKGIGAAAPELFAPITAAARTAASETEAIMAGVSRSVQESAIKARAVSAGSVLPGGGGMQPHGVGHSAPHGTSHSGFHFRPHGMSVPGGHLGMSQGGDGMVPLVGGLVIGDLIKEGIAQGFEMQHWNSQFQAAGFSNDDIGQAQGAAWRNAGLNPNASATDSMRMILELNKATGHLDASLALLPQFSVAESVMQSVKAEGLHDHFNAGGQVLNFAKALEEMGATQKGDTPEEREANTKLYAAEALRTMIASRGLTDGNSLFAMTNNSGGAAQNWDLRMATTVAPLLGDIMKHSKLGNADYMALKSYAGGGITSKAVESLMGAGLVDEDLKLGNVYENKSGWHLKENSKFAEGISENVYDWSRSKLDVLEAHGHNTHNQKEMNEIINGIGSNKSTTMLLRALLEPGTRSQLTKEMVLRDRVPGNAASILQDQDPVLKLDALHKKWDDFLAALGGPMVDPALAALTKMTAVLNSFAQAMHDHPELTKMGGEAAGVAGVGLLGYGGARMLGFGGGDSGLGAAATQLDASALALKEAAIALGGGGHGAGIPPGASVPQTPGKPSIGSLAWPFAIYEGGKAAIDSIVPWIAGSTPEQHARAQAYNPWDHPIFPGAKLPGFISPAEAATRPAGGFSPGSGMRTPGDQGLHRDEGFVPGTGGQKFGELIDRSGILKASFTTLDDGTLALNDNFKGLSGGSGGLKNALDILAATAMGAARTLAQVAMSGGGVGGGGGFTNASWGGGDSGGGLHPAVAHALGLGSGSGGGGSYIGSGGTDQASGAGFTAGMRARNLGNIGYFHQHTAGLIGPSNSRDVDHSIALFGTQEDGIRAAANLALHKYMGGRHSTWDLIAAAGGWTPGSLGPGASVNIARAMGLGNRDDIHLDRPEMMRKFLHGLAIQEHGKAGAYYTDEMIGSALGRVPTAGPSKTITPGRPAGKQNAPMLSVQLINHTHLDGKRIATAVTHHQVAEMEHPNSVGGPDGYGFHGGPDTALNDAA